MIAPKGVLSLRTRPGNWVGRPPPRTSTFLLLSTRLQLRSRHRHERVPLRTATTALRPKLKSCAEEKKLDVVADGPTHPITWAGAQRKCDFGRILGLEPTPPFSKCAILLIFVAQSTPHRCKSYVGFLFSASMGPYTPKNTKMAPFFF